jgi:hypothetical protein
MVLLYHSSEIPVTLKAGKNVFLWSDALLKLTHLVIHSTFSQTLLEESWVWVRHLNIIIRFLLDIVKYIIRWRLEQVIQRKVAASNTLGRLGLKCAVGWFSKVHHTEMDWVA